MTQRYISFTAVYIYGNTDSNGYRLSRFSSQSLFIVSGVGACGDVMEYITTTENEINKILWGFEKQSDQGTSDSRPLLELINKKQKRKPAE